MPPVNGPLPTWTSDILPTAGHWRADSGQDNMVEISDRLQIRDSELSWTFVRSGGPGGQNVNKVASRAVLRWRLAANRTLPAEVMLRLRTLQRNRITTDGDLLVHSQRYRDQERNRQDCLDKLRGMVLEAVRRRRPRRATQPTRAARERRLAGKRRRAERKADRRRQGED
jgi:ribosome-associated protein